MTIDDIDGGWGWIVVIGAFIHHVITHGVFFSIGIIFVSLQEALGGTKAEIAWIVSIEIGSGFLSGPVTGYLISTYGTRFVSVVGSILGASGYIISAWVDNIYILYATMGVLAGVGIGMIIITAIVVVNGYFHKHRGFAVGISMAGTGVGAFIFNPFLDWMVKMYGWRGSLLLIAAIILNCIPAGLVYRPLVTRRTNNKTRAIQGPESNTVTNNDTDVYKPLFRSHDGCIELIYDFPDDKQKQSDTTIHEQSDLMLQNNNLTKDDLGHSVTIQVSSSVTTIQERRTGCLQQLSLFKNAVFTMFVSAQFLFNFGFYVPYVYIPDKSKLEGVDETSTVWVLSTMGLSSIVGRIVFGYIADRPSVNRLLLYTCGFLISGTVTALVPWYNQLWLMYCFAVINGMFTGMVLGLTPVVLVDLLGLEILPATFGISCLFRGLASLLGSPCAGFLVDITGTFTAAFVVAGTCMMSGSLVMTIARSCQNILLREVK